MYFPRATWAIIICLVAEALSAGSSTERTSNKLEADDTTGSISSKPESLSEDNVADSSVTSYSSIVIHHSSGKGKEGAADDQDKQGSRSESYFKLHNGKSALGRTRDDKQHRRPSYTSSSSSSSLPTSPASTSSLTSQDAKNHRVELSRSRLRDGASESFKSFPKIKNFEGDFKPIEGPTTEEPRRPQRLVNHHYNPHHHESSEEDMSTSLAGSSQEIYRKEPKYRDYDHSVEQFNSGESYHSAEDHRPKFNKGYKDDKKHGFPYRNEEFRKPLHGGNYKHYSEAPEHKINDYSTIYKSSPSRLNGPTPPPGMSDELMETLLQQEPQKFSDGDREKPKSYLPKKKFKSAGSDNPTSFNVGYSIGFGGPPSDDVVFGKPKDQGLKIHVNGEKSVWKHLNSGVEMSHNVDKVKPIQYRVPDSTVRPVPKINVLKNGGSSVYYMNNNSPDIENVPTYGKSTFDHNQALTHSNLFDFSNAMQGPIALPLQSNIAPEVQPFGVKPKAGRNLDIMGLYQSMGYSPPIPVLIPGGPKGEAQMVHAIVIPLQSLPNVDLGWGQLSGMLAAPGIVPGPPAPQSVHFNPSGSIGHIPLNPVNHNSIHHNSIHSSGPSSFKSNHHVNYHPVSNPFPAIPEKIRSPKYHRKAKDTFKSGSAFSSPIVVAPMSHSDTKKDLQRELNNILAKEMSRKNQRHTPLGLRPPLPH